MVLGQLNWWISSCKGIKLGLYLTLYNINSKWVKELNVRANILKMRVDKKKSVNLYDLGVSSSFLGTTSKAQAST